MMNDDDDDEYDSGDSAYYIVFIGMNMVLFLAKDDVNGCEVISFVFCWPIGNIIQGGPLLVLYMGL